MIAQVQAPFQTQCGVPRGSVTHQRPAGEKNPWLLYKCTACLFSSRGVVSSHRLCFTCFKAAEQPVASAHGLQIHNRLKVKKKRSSVIVFVCVCLS